jgi:hypothetical protein
LRKQSCHGYEIRKQDHKQKKGMNILRKISKRKNDSTGESFCLFSKEDAAENISRFNLAEKD